LINISLKGSQEVNSILKINIKVLALTIIFFSLIEPDYFTSIEIIHLIYIGMRFVTLLIALLYCYTKKHLPKITLIITLYFIIYGYATYNNDGNLFNLFNYSMSIISFVIWIEIILKNNPLPGLQSLNIVYSSLVYLNLLFFIVFPEGYMQILTSRGEFVNRYFLGIYNQFAATLIPAIIVNVIYVHLRYARIKLQTLILIGVSLFTFVYFWSATSLVGVSLIIIYLILFRKSILNKLVKLKVIFPIMIGIYLIIVVLDRIGIFSFIIEKLLNKDVTLSTRTIIWDAAIEMIKMSPYFGYGYLGDGGKYIVFSAVNQKDAHNTLFQLMLQHGILGLIPLIILLIFFIKSMAKSNKSFIGKFVLYSFFVATTMMINEVYSFKFILLILMLGVFVPYIIKEQEKLLNKD